MKVIFFKISDDKTKIDLTIDDSENISTLYLFDEHTYKDYNEGIDLSSKLTGSLTENIEITPSDLNITEFNGLYIIEASDSDEVSLEITSELSLYKECILEKVIALSICDDCLKNNSSSIQNAHQLLLSLEMAIELQFIDEMLNIINTLKKYCSNSCRTCGEYNNIINND